MCMLFFLSFTFCYLLQRDWLTQYLSGNLLNSFSHVTSQMVIKSCITQTFFVAMETQIILASVKIKKYIYIYIGFIYLIKKYWFQIQHIQSPNDVLKAVLDTLSVSQIAAINLVYQPIKKRKTFLKTVMRSFW